MSFFKKGVLDIVLDITGVTILSYLGIVRCKANPDRYLHLADIVVAVMMCAVGKRTTLEDSQIKNQRDQYLAQEWINSKSNTIDIVSLDTNMMY